MAIMLKKPLEITEATLPFKLKNIHYYGDRFAGDLIITTGVIYFFPIRDLDKEREKDQNHRGLLGYAIRKVKENERERKYKNKSYFDQNNLWNSKADEEIIRKRLDNHIDELRSKDEIIFSSFLTNTKEISLPLPMRFEINSVKNIKLLSNQLYFETVADKHNFDINPYNIRLLSDVIQKARFIN